MSTAAPTSWQLNELARIEHRYGHVIPELTAAGIVRLDVCGALESPWASIELDERGHIRSMTVDPRSLRIAANAELNRRLLVELRYQPYEWRTAKTLADALDETSDRIRAGLAELVDVDEVETNGKDGAGRRWRLYGLYDG